MRKKIKNVMTAACSYFILSPNLVYAAASSTDGIDQLLNFLYSILGAVGGVLVVYEFGMLILALRTENSPEIPTHITKLIVGVALMNIKKFM